MLSGRRKKQSRLFTTEENHNQNQPVVSRRPYGYRDRGMSPARYSQDGVDEECHTGEFSGYSSESSQGWRETPKRATAYSSRRNNRLNHSRNNVTGLTFCLSPLVRASPNRRLPPETSLSGDKPHLSNAASYCANRSRKLADIGRFNPNYWSSISLSSHLLLTRGRSTVLPLLFLPYYSSIIIIFFSFFEVYTL
jgi:hypothetical protein